MRSTRKLAAVGAVLLVTAAGAAIAQTIMHDHSMGPGHMQEMMGSGQYPMGPGHMRQMMASGQHPAMGPDQMQEMMRQHQGMMPMTGMHGASSTPTLPGQGAFGAI